MQEIQIDTEFIKLDSFMKFSGIVGSGSDAKMLIKDGEVKLNGEVVTQRGKKIYKSDCIEFEGELYKII